MTEYKGRSTLPLISIPRDVVEETLGKTLTDKQWAIVREEILYQTFRVQQKMKDIIMYGKFNDFLQTLDKVYQEQNKLD